MSAENVSNPSAEFAALAGLPPSTPEVEAERRKWKSLCAALIEERERLLRQLARARTDHDEYLKSVWAVPHEEYHFTKEEIFAQLGKQPTLQQIIAELEQRLEK